MLRYVVWIENELFLGYFFGILYSVDIINFFNGGYWNRYGREEQWVGLGIEGFGGSLAIFEEC